MVALHVVAPLLGMLQNLPEKPSTRIALMRDDHTTKAFCVLKTVVVDIVRLHPTDFS